MTSNSGRWAGERSRSRSRPTGARETIMAGNESPRWRRLDWLSEARCKDEPTEIFFAGDNERGIKLRRSERRAKRICWSCPVLEACRNYALNEREPYGIWGALTPSERRLLTR